MTISDQTSRRSLLLLAAAGLAFGRPGPARAANKTVLVFGDSLVAGLGLSEQDGFVAQFQAALDKANAGVSLINGGVSGDTTAMALDRLDWTLGDNPNGVLLELGANDMLQGIAVDTIRQNLDAIMNKLTAHELPVFVAGMEANRALGPDYVKAFDAIYPELAGKYGATLYPFFLDGVALDPKLNQADGIHPNAAGVKVIVERMLPAFTAWLAQLS
ncbi:MAG TPA: arylesterase [Devosiaceae bacterium]|nr:arylesterase [Devosiaceae bacterium]